MMLIRRRLCGGCMKRLDGPEKCSCAHPQPQWFMVRQLEPLKLEYTATVKPAARAVR